jgi:GNAT superfamily N-acetyltransferase
VGGWRPARSGTFTCFEAAASEAHRALQGYISSAVTSESISAAAVEIRELPIGQTHLAHQAMRSLRTAYVSEREFVEYVDGVLRPAEYRLVGVLTAGRPYAVAIAGFRAADSLAWGYHLYVDDLATTPDARRQGHGGALLDWLIEEGARLGCGQLHLDSGTGSERFDAHRLYHGHGLSISSHHFARWLPIGPKPMRPIR